MLSKRNKIMFLAFTVIIPFLLYSVYYFSKMLHRAKFKEQDFVSLRYTLTKDSLNSIQYDSKSGALITYSSAKVDTIKCLLGGEDIKLFFRKAGTLGFWNLPQIIGDEYRKESNTKVKVEFQFKDFEYDIVMYEHYTGNKKMKNTFLDVVAILQAKVEDCM